MLQASAQRGVQVKLKVVFLLILTGCVTILVRELGTSLKDQISERLQTAAGKSGFISVAGNAASAPQTEYGWQTLPLPKVAMLFLSMGELRHETLWADWLHLADIELNKIFQQQEVTPKFHLTSGRERGASLFTIYVHLPPDVATFPQTSFFHGREISDRIAASWGSFELAEITRRLLAAALLNAENERFITLSEACVPLYPPTVAYSQLMHTRLSRINACTSREGWSTDGYRWTWRLTEITNGSLKQDMWRKNHQWLGLNRKHAQLIVDDTVISEAFRKHCYSGKDPDFGGWWRTCISDEHYFSTLLAYHNLEQETDCYGELTHTEWCHDNCDAESRLHPRTYKNEEVSIALFRDLRQESDGCDAEQALVYSLRTLAKLMEMRNGNVSTLQSYIMPPRCPLFARKFSDDAINSTQTFLMTLFHEDMQAAQMGE